jgi:exosortase F-associated protein
MEKRPGQPRLKSKAFRLLIGLFAVLCLALIYLFQRVNYFEAITAGLHISTSGWSPTLVFVFNKTLRLILNDFACFLLILAIFRHRKYLHAAFFLFLVEIGILLPLYFVLKLNLEGTSEISSPLLSQIHRLIVNPTLMVLLMMGFVFQKLKGNP